MISNFPYETSFLKDIPRPFYFIDTDLLERNLKQLSHIKEATGCKILLAQKSFASYAWYPQIARHLDGVAASSLYEARLGREEFGKEVHTYAPVYRENDWDEILECSDHIIFNSLSQKKKYLPATSHSGNADKFGLRINPLYSSVPVAKYNPCAPGSRFGIPIDALKEEDLEGIAGIHIHALCEQGAEALAEIVEVVEAKIGHLLHKIKWLNLGGGHHITLPDYNQDLLIRWIRHLQNKYKVEVVLEPGEAVVIQTGFLFSKVEDILWNEKKIAILDVSATAHMPDVLEMPYKTKVFGAVEPESSAKTESYLMGGTTCLSGDVIGEYHFPGPLQLGMDLIFDDMAHYTIVKTTMFNGVHHPSLVMGSFNEQKFKIIKEFNYLDFKNRL